MNIPPEPILHATLATLHHATVACRNWTLRKDVPIQMVNDLMEAIHEVPAFLADWDRHSVDEISLHLSGFDAKSWRGRVDQQVFHVFDLVEVFQDRREQFEETRAVEAMSDADLLAVNAQFSEALRMAIDDLGLAGTINACIEWNGSQIHYPALIEGFGYQGSDSETNGLAICPIAKQAAPGKCDDASEAATAAGYAAIHLSHRFRKYERERYVDLFSTFDWCGAGDPPVWYKAPFND